MITKYAVFNPMTGSHEKVNTEEEALNLVTDNIIKLYHSHVNGVLYTVITIDEAGNETWNAGGNGTELPQEYIDAYKAKVLND